MSAQTIGSFLCEKGLNFVRFVNDGLGRPALPESFVSEVGMCTFAMHLSENRVVISQRDWLGLHKLTEAQELKSHKTDLQECLREIKINTDMHDKFWLYMELFADSLTA